MFSSHSALTILSFPHYHRNYKPLPLLGPAPSYDIFTTQLHGLILIHIHLAPPTPHIPPPQHISPISPEPTLQLIIIRIIPIIPKVPKPLTTHPIQTTL